MQLLIWIASVTGAAGVLGGLLALVLRAARGIRRMTHFFDDWFGEAARPGVDGTPGVMTRLKVIEHELRPNSGKSLRDRVDLIERHVRPATTGG